MHAWGGGCQLSIVAAHLHVADGVAEAGDDLAIGATERTVSWVISWSKSMKPSTMMRPWLTRPPAMA